MFRASSFLFLSQHQPCGLLCMSRILLCVSSTAGKQQQQQQQTQQQQKYSIFLDPPFSPVFRDERPMRRSSSPSSRKSADEFKVLCASCRYALFDSADKLLGYPAWPTFHSIIDSSSASGRAGPSRVKLVSDDVKDILMGRGKSASNTVEDDARLLEELHLPRRQETEGDDDSPASTTRRKKSLILRSEPPVMRWGTSAAVGLEKEDRVSHEKRKVLGKIKQQNGTPFKGLVSKSKPLRTVDLIRHAPTVTRGYCATCDSFVCVAIHGRDAQASETGVRYVVNPSSVIFH